MKRFLPNDKAYIVENNRFIEEVSIIKATSKDAIVRLPRGGGIRLPLSRIFETEKEAEESIHPLRQNSDTTKPTRKYTSTPYDWGR